MRWPASSGIRIQQIPDSPAAFPRVVQGAIGLAGQPQVRARNVARLHIPDIKCVLVLGVRGLAIIIVAIVALSATARGHHPFVPRPTGPMPAVNVP
jgi:hypothetical protein